MRVSLFLSNFMLNFYWSNTELLQMMIEMFIAEKSVLFIAELTEKMMSSPIMVFRQTGGFVDAINQTAAAFFKILRFRALFKRVYFIGGGRVFRHRKNVNNERFDKSAEKKVAFIRHFYITARHFHPVSAMT